MRTILYINRAEEGIVVPGGRTLTPVTDDIFEVFRRQYAYDKTPLNAVLEAAETTDTWVREIVEDLGPNAQRETRVA